MKKPSDLLNFTAMEKYRWASAKGARAAELGWLHAGLLCACCSLRPGAPCRRHKRHRGGSRGLVRGAPLLSHCPMPCRPYFKLKSFFAMEPLPDSAFQVGHRAWEGGFQTQLPLLRLACLSQLPLELPPRPLPWT